MSEKTLDGEIRYYEDGTPATAENLNKPLEDLAKTGQYMSKAQFEKNREDTRREMAGNGFIEFGRHYGSEFNTGISGWSGMKINEGMWTANGNDWNDNYKENIIIIGNDRTTPLSNRAGKSETYNAIINANGSRINIGKYNDSGLIKMPEAPTLVPSDGNILPNGLKHGDYIYYINRPNVISNSTFDSLTDWRENQSGIMSVENNKLIVDKIAESSPRTTISLGYLTPGTYKFNIELGGDASTYRFVTTSSSYSGGTSINSGGTTLDDDQVFTIYKYREYYLVLGIPESQSIGSHATFTNVSITPNDTLYMKMNGNDTDGLEVYRCADIIGQNTMNREDIVFIETWHEKVAEKDIVYPYGDVQYRGNNTDGLSGITEGTFSGAETYSQYGEWEAEGNTIGQGYKWSELINDDKLKFVSNPEHNIYLSGDDVFQVRFRFKTVLGCDTEPFRWNTSVGSRLSANKAGHQMDNIMSQQPQGKRTTQQPFVYGNGYNIYWNKSKATGYINIAGSYMSGSTITEGGTSSYMAEEWDNYAAIPVALVQKRNKGAFHPIYNINGCALFPNDTKWFDTPLSVSSILDCFTYAEEGGILSSKSGRPDKLFYDSIDERDIEDLRVSARKINDHTKYLEDKTFDLLNDRLRSSVYEYDIITKQKTIKQENTAVNLNEGITSGSGAYDGVGISTFYRPLPTQSIIGTSGNILIEDSEGKKILGPGYYGSYYIGYSKVFYPGISDRLLALKGPVNLKSFGDDEARKVKHNNTSLVCDIIGDPETYPQDWKDNGVFGLPLTMGPNGEDYINISSLDEFIPYNGRVGRKITLSRKMKGPNSTVSYIPNTKLILQYNKTNNTYKEVLNIGNHTEFGNGYTDITASSSCNIHNHIYIAEDNFNDMLYLVFYDISTTIPVANNSKVESLGEAIRLRNYTKSLGSNLVSDCIAKIANCASSDTQRVSVNNITKSESGIWDYETGYPEHESFRDRAGYDSDATIKILPYLTTVSDRSVLKFFYKEMKLDVNTNILSVVADGIDTLTVPKGQPFRIIGLDNKEFDGKILTHSGFTDRTFAANSFDDYNVVNGKVYVGTAISSFQEWNNNIWGDDNKFQTNNSQSIMTDDNGNYVLYGQKQITLDSFI